MKKKIVFFSSSAVGQVVEWRLITQVRTVDKEICWRLDWSVVFPVSVALG